MTTEQLQRQALINQMLPKTNHILHLILSVLTGGLWLPVWLIVGVANSHRAYHMKADAPAFKIDVLMVKVITASAFLLVVFFMMWNQQ